MVVTHRLVVGLVAAMLVGLTADPVSAASQRERRCPPKRFTFRPYYLGAGFEGLPFFYVQRDCPPPGPGGRRNDTVTYFYGRCRARAAGCAPPLQVTSAPLCQAHVGIYFFPPLERLVVRGVPGALFEGYTLDVYTGRTTVALIATRRSVLVRAAEAMRRAPRANVPSGNGEGLARLRLRQAPLTTRPRLAPPRPEELASKTPCR